MPCNLSLKYPLVRCSKPNITPGRAQSRSEVVCSLAYCSTWEYSKSFILALKLSQWHLMSVM